MLCVSVTGYGFVDFETAHAAELAVKALQTNGVQAQMAKVRVLGLQYSVCIVLQAVTGHKTPRT